MDIDNVYKKLKNDASMLIDEERALQGRIEEIQRLKKDNDRRRANVEKLKQTLEDLLDG